MGTMNLPNTMKALLYSEAGQFGITNLPLPILRDGDVLMRVKVCGVCGTDVTMHDGGFIARYPLVPGHEAVGVVAAVGKNVRGFVVGERVVADNTEVCGECSFCRRGEPLLCEDFGAHGATLNGALAEFCAYPAGKVFKIHNLDNISATLVEPASCVAHGVDKISPRVGSSILIFGSGPTGLLLAQFLKQTGGSHIVIAAPEGSKLELARSLRVGDVYFGLNRESRDRSQAELSILKTSYPLGFDIVIEATGSEFIANEGIQFVRRGGKYVIYGAYKKSARVSWSPADIFQNEITVVGSFCEMHKFPAAIEYLESGKVKVEGIVNKTYKLEEWGSCLEDLRQKRTIKAAILMD